MASSRKPAPLPIGTQVVALAPAKGPQGELLCAAGSVGVVVGLATTKDTYNVRLTDGSVLTFPRAGLGIRKHLQLESARHSRSGTAPNLREYIIYRCVVGSRAFGLDEESSDDLIHRKVSRNEKTNLDSSELPFHRSEFTRLLSNLESAAKASALPDSPSAKPALHDFLVRLRLNG